MALENVVFSLLLLSILTNRAWSWSYTFDTNNSLALLHQNASILQVAVNFEVQYLVLFSDNTVLSYNSSLLNATEKLINLNGTEKKKRITFFRSDPVSWGTCIMGPTNITSQIVSVLGSNNHSLYVFTYS